MKLPILLAAALMSALTASAEGPLAPWAGVPLATLEDMGTGAPRLELRDSGWRAPLPDGGFVQVIVHPDLEAARRAFEFQAVAASTMPTAPWPLPGEEPEVEARSAGAGFLILRDRNVVMLVRDHGEDAPAWAGRLRAALVVEPPPGVVERRTVDGVEATWDACGRRTPAPTER